MRINLSSESWGRVVLTTVLGTVLCVAVAVYVDSYNFASMSGARLVHALLIDILVPICLAVPLLLVFGSKLRELAIANRRLTLYASTDGLTQILNRAAFSTLVSAYLDEVRRKESGSGALLILDADNFKVINDRFGHDQGDEALIAIAATMKSAVHSPDIVGRLGGEEFGIFLPGADRTKAEAVGENIRKAISDYSFIPNGHVHRLSVSVGGALFAGPITLPNLFRFADEQLYAAKGAGRNRVSIAQADRRAALAAA